MNLFSGVKNIGIFIKTHRALSALIIVGLFLGVVGLVWVMARSSDSNFSTPSFLSQLPLANIGGEFKDQGNQPTTAPDFLEATPTPPIANEGLLAVTVNNKAGVFSLGEITYTNLLENVEQYAPTDPSQAFSRLRIYSASNQVLGEYPFRITTTVVLEGFDASGKTLTGEVHSLNASSVYLITPLNRSSKPAKVEFLTQQGVVIESKNIPSLETSEHGSSLKKIAFLLGRNAAAQFGAGVLSQSSGCVRPIRMVVTNEVTTNSQQQIQAAAAIANVEGQLNAMMTDLQPWPDFADCFEVSSKFNNGTPLGCTLEGTGTLFPVCAGGSIISEVSGGDITIVVHPGTSCNCGSAYSSTVTAVGTNANFLLLGHELGHAIGKMVDEYLYLTGSTSPIGPNCFVSAAACNAAGTTYGVTPFCEFGCNAPGTYRPSSLLMHNSPIADYGPVEVCIMRKELTRLTRKDGFECSDRD